ncbi:MAG: ATP-binding cassette domain-containing protein [Calothrix sp. FI2-JRJ7]|jgi:D-methionine transport system ATP-binding protein|nr:ATP-binding cassette domain-containing protein [Calothrix sp. FI2-JRJ7]
MHTILRLEQVSLNAKLNVNTKENLPGYSILKDISFEVPTGARVAIVGATGAGKTFLLRLLNRLSEPTSGKIYFDHQDYSLIPVQKLRSEIVLVPQESRLLGMTVKDALSYPLVLRGLPKTEITQRVSQWVELLQIPDDWLGRGEVQLSYGQRQLVAIARALAIQPKVLLLDEPTSNLDVGTTQRLLQTFKKLVDTTVLIVNHQLDIASSCDNVIHLSQGRLISNQRACDINWELLKASIIQAEAEDDFI